MPHSKKSCVCKDFKCWIPRNPAPEAPVGKLRICKEISQYFNNDAEFTITIDPPANGVSQITFITVGGTTCFEISNVTPGNYTVTEIVPTDWKVISANPQNAAVTLGSTTIVTFINEFDCDFTKGVGVRYKNLANLSGGGEIYLGVGDLGQALNRTENEYVWGTSATELKTYPFTFTFNPASPNKLTQSLSGGTSGLVTSQYPAVPPLTDGVGDFTYLPGPVTANMAQLDMFELIISNRGNPPAGTVVNLCDLQLTTSQGSYPVLNNGAACFSPALGQQIIVKYPWPNDGSTPFAGFTFTGNIQTQGIPGSNENSKVEIQIGKCADV